MDAWRGCEPALPQILTAQRDRLSWFEQFPQGESCEWFLSSVCIDQQLCRAEEHAAALKSLFLDVTTQKEISVTADLSLLGSLPAGTAAFFCL